MSIKVASFWDEPYEVCKEKEILEKSLKDDVSRERSCGMHQGTKKIKRTTFANSYEASPKIPGHKREKTGKIYRGYKEK